MQIDYPETGICGLACRLCPTFHTEGTSRCGGCKSDYRMGAGCPFITCAVKRKGIEFCWQCAEQDTCGKWQGHREYSHGHDTFTCYQKLDDNIAFIREYGIAAFDAAQKVRQQLLEDMLREFNEGRSKRFYCIAATVMEIEELETALEQARRESADQDIKARSRLLHSLLDAVAARKGYVLKLRK